jgi:hypothetical protein
MFYNHSSSKNESRSAAGEAGKGPDLPAEDTSSSHRSRRQTHGADTGSAPFKDISPISADDRGDGAGAYGSRDDDAGDDTAVPDRHAPSLLALSCRRAQNE